MFSRSPKAGHIKAGWSDFRNQRFDVRKTSENYGEMFAYAVTDFHPWVLQNIQQKTPPQIPQRTKQNSVMSGTLGVWWGPRTSKNDHLCDLMKVSRLCGPLGLSSVAAMRLSLVDQTRKRHININFLVRLLLGRPRECPWDKPRFSPYFTQWKPS